MCDSNFFTLSRKRKAFSYDFKTNLLFTNDILCPVSYIPITGGPIGPAHFALTECFLETSYLILIPRRTYNKSSARSSVLLKRELLPEDVQKGLVTGTHNKPKQLNSYSDEF